MKSATIVFFLLSAILFLGTFKYLLDYKKPGVYPPKQVLMKRIRALAGGGGICLLLASMLSYFL
ncbi:hypothetical protein ABES02_27240 [Neobacillus pocheonensis]|uniref:hypothetical protein n=1 Tax=Neobacillus pocheonensis TaxID=363869 RepID=UPI003D29FFFF